VNQLLVDIRNIILLLTFVVANKKCLCVDLIGWKTGIVQDTNLWSN